MQYIIQDGKFKIEFYIGDSNIVLNRRHNTSKSYHPYGNIRWVYDKNDDWGWNFSVNHQSCCMDASELQSMVNIMNQMLPYKM